MLALNVSGKSSDDALSILKEAVSGTETELKILIDSPSQAAELQKFLASEGFRDILPEDDDGTLYLTAVRDDPAQKTAQTPAKTPAMRKFTRAVEGGTLCVVMSRRAGKYELEFCERFAASLVECEAKPDVLCLMDGAVKLAAYDSPSCDTLKRLESLGVRILISNSCADRMRITEAVGAGVLVSMSEIFEAVSSCEKLLSI